MNDWGRDRVPFLFIIDFELNKIVLLDEPLLDLDTFQFSIDGFVQNLSAYSATSIPKPEILTYPVEKTLYAKAFSLVKENILHGNSYLLNLTFPTRIEVNLDLFELFSVSKARYKLWWKDRLVVFSPETFIRIKNHKIYSYPMKGTIDALLPDAQKQLLEDQKELAEHFTIVDLIRNDLGKVSKSVKVNQFRYVEKIKGNNRELLQTSSEIIGDLAPEWNTSLGDLMMHLLPAGSVSGAPKAKTLEIIGKAEAGPRGYYTGVFGYFNGFELDSGVMIRYIEKAGDQMLFRSGGGITFQSKMESEYEELMQKIYVPID